MSVRGRRRGVCLFVCLLSEFNPSSKPPETISLVDIELHPRQSCLQHENRPEGTPIPAKVGIVHKVSLYIFYVVLSSVCLQKKTFVISSKRHLFINWVRMCLKKRMYLHTSFRKVRSKRGTMSKRVAHWDPCMGTEWVIFLWGWQSKASRRADTSTNFQHELKYTSQVPRQPQKELPLINLSIHQLQAQLPAREFSSSLV